MIQVKIKVNRNQDPELYELLSKTPSKSGLARDLMNQAIRKDKYRESPAGATITRRGFYLSFTL